MKNKFWMCCMVFVLQFFLAQNSFEYQRTWGTYFGPSGGQIAGIYYSSGILFDGQKNMYMRGNIWYGNSYTNTYYSQFLAGNGTYIDNPSAFEVKMSNQGVPTYFSYTNGLDPYSFLESTDLVGNLYRVVYGNPSLQATPGVYLSTDPQPSVARKILLAKYTATGALVWATYLPSSPNAIMVRLDPMGNIYVTGTTRLTTDVTTSNVWQENFDVLYDSQGQLIPNPYLLKLNNNGQRIWGTYMPSLAKGMDFFNGGMYIAMDKNINPNLNTMATPGAYQTSPSDLVLTKVNANTGSREWGTYYGPSLSGNPSAFTDLAVNETGFYITGTDFNYDNSNFFGTPTSHKQYVTGGADLYLSKFTLDGNRVWSTYFGTSGYDGNEFDNVIALKGDDVYITGSTTGVSNNIATPGAYKTAPEQNTDGSTNLYFAKFKSNGTLSWCSYYGGTTSYAGILVPINVAINNHSLFLFGSTNSNNGFTTAGAWMPNRVPSNTNLTTCFIAQFDLKEPLSALESSDKKDLELYNNPNNGQFYLQGRVLEKKNFSIKIYDSTGRLVAARKLGMQTKQSIDMQGLLQKGNYLVEVQENDTTTYKTFKMVVR